MSNWFQKLSAKQYATVFHVSPESNLYRLKPTGNKSGTRAVDMNEPGIYVSPKFSTALKWWFSFVVGKKEHKQNTNRSERLKDKGKGFHGMPMRYQTLTVYKIQIPKNILENLWYSNFWEEEYFIPEKYIDELNIVSSKTMTANEALPSVQRIERKDIETDRNRKAKEKELNIEKNKTWIANEYKRLKNQLHENLTNNYNYTKKQISEINKYLKELSYIIYGWSFNDNAPSGYKNLNKEYGGTNFILENPTKEINEKAQKLINILDNILNSATKNKQLSNRKQKLEERKKQRKQEEFEKSMAEMQRKY